MITLTDHSCFFCQHLNRKERTLHGKWVEHIRKIQQEQEQCVENCSFDRLRRLNKREEVSRKIMTRIERGEYSSAMQYR